MAGQPPKLGVASRCFVGFAGAAAQWSTARSWAISLACLATPVLLEPLSGPTVDLGFGYLLASGIAVWCLGERMGMVLAIVTLTGGALLRHAQFAHGMLPSEPGIATQLWNALMRLLSIGLLALAVGGLRGVLSLERWRASSDGLTGALNKVAFDRKMQQAVEAVRDRDRVLVLCYMDLDGFKTVNDRFGHSAGDHVLRAFAHAAARCIRATDLFARLGGDEFAALMIVHTPEEGDRVAEILHRRLTEILAATGFDVTCSMGAVVMASSDAAADIGVMEQADALMYEAKRAGKNALRVARGSLIAPALRAAYRPFEDDALEDFLARIDRAERRTQLHIRRAA